MSLARYLARLGYGSRREMERRLRLGDITHADGTRLTDAASYAHHELRIGGEPLDPPPGVVILLHKPVGYVCSTQDRPPLVYDLLPPRFPHRTPVMATVGRLDADTSGLLLLTDDGDLNHRLSSPRHHVPKTYRVELAEPLRGDEGASFASGTLRLQGEATPLKPADLLVVSDRLAELTIHEGRYHQVRRMFAAVGNHVAALTRIALGPLTLGTMSPGSWRVLTPEEVDRLRQPPPALPNTLSSNPERPI